MNIPSILPRLKGFRYPRKIIAYAVWAYHRLALSTADVEDLLAARGVIVSRETVKRSWYGPIVLADTLQIASDEIVRERTTNGTWTKS